MRTLKQRVDGQVLVVELCRAARGNALSREMQGELAQVWAAFEASDALRVGVLHGAPEVFSIGHDVAELAADPSVSPIPADAMYPLHLDKPVIAAVEGPCYGLGFELALSCDLRVASQAARFGFPDSNLAVPYRVAAVLLPRMTFLGAGLASILAGHLSSAEEMRELGLVGETVPAGTAADRALALAQAMCRRVPTGDFRKQAIWRLSGVPIPAAMQAARALR